jgi:hypothetical protein
MTLVDFVLKATQGDGDNLKKCVFLYDIGCNMEKGVIRVGFHNCLLFNGDEILPI